MQRDRVAVNSFGSFKLRTQHIYSMPSNPKNVRTAYPPRSFPPSFNAANLVEDKLREIKAARKLREAFPMLGKPEENKPK